jgi:septum site-determining protein MinC
MKDAVMIKSFPKGIVLHLEEEIPFEELLEEIALKFSEARSFFGKTAVALSIEGRLLSPSEEVSILDAIHANSDLKIVCIVGKNEETNRNFIKALSRAERKINECGDGQFVRGSLKRHETFETAKSVIVLGDICQGGRIISAKNIIVLGGLYGEAYAGASGSPDAFIAALEMQPEELRVGDFKYIQHNRRITRGLPRRKQPKIAYVKNDQITIEELAKDMLSDF